MSETYTDRPETHPSNRSEMVWKIVAGVLAVAFAVTFTVGFARGGGTNDAASKAASASSTAASASSIAAARLKIENVYLGQLGTYANYLAAVDFALCASTHTDCPTPPKFPDPPGLPHLGVFSH